MSGTESDSTKSPKAKTGVIPPGQAIRALVHNIFIDNHGKLARDLIEMMKNKIEAHHLEKIREIEEKFASIKSLLVMDKLQLKKELAMDQNKLAIATEALKASLEANKSLFTLVNNDVSDYAKMNKILLADNAKLVATLDSVNAKEKLVNNRAEIIRNDISIPLLKMSDFGEDDSHWLFDSKETFHGYHDGSFFYFKDSRIDPCLKLPLSCVELEFTEQESK